MAPMASNVVTLTKLGAATDEAAGIKTALTEHTTASVALTTRMADGSVNFNLQPSALLLSSTTTVTGSAAKLRHCATALASTLMLATPATTTLLIADRAPANPTSNDNERLEMDDATGFEKLRLIEDMVTPYAETGTGGATTTAESVE